MTTIAAALQDKESRSAKQCSLGMPAAAQEATLTALTEPMPTRGRAGYYTINDTKCLSVADVARATIPNTDMIRWVADEVARCAVTEFTREQRLVAVERIRQAAEAKLRAAVDLGGEVHRIIESHILDRPDAEPTPECAPFVAAFHRFVADHRPVFEATELLLANPERRYAGKVDAYAVIPAHSARLMLLDWQTGAAVHPETALALAAHRHATIGWTFDGTEIEPPCGHGAVVVHIRPQRYPRGYAIYPINTSEQVFDSFLSALDVAINWTDRAAADVIGAPLPLKEN